MKMMSSIWAPIVFAVVCLFAGTSNAGIVIFNQNDPLTTTVTGGHGNYAGFNLTLNDPAFSTTYTAPHSAPTPSTIFLQGLMLRRSTGSGGTNNVFLRVHSGTTPTAGNFVGVSTNTLDMRAQASESNVTFTFADLALNTATNYSFYFSTSNVATPTGMSLGRIRVSNSAADTFTSGSLRNASFATQDSAFDPVFVMSAVPEPSALLFVGATVATVVLRRRRQA